MDNVLTSETKREALPVSLDDPHFKTSLTSPLGRFVERASYTDLAVACTIIILMATAYFCWGPVGHTLKASERNLVESAYFSIVTFTSLGYGDLSPVGFGRLVAVLVVAFGLFFIALMVGKFASERQQAVLLLIHTSDCQRRLNNFMSEIESVRARLKLARIRFQNLDACSAVKKLAALVEATSNYLVFNANQARLIEFGNESALLALYGELAAVQRLCIDVHTSEKTDLLLSRKTRALALRCEGLVMLMQRFHASSELQTSYTLALWRRLSALFNWRKQEPSSLMRRVSSVSSSMRANGENLRSWTRSGYTPAMVEAVWNAAPHGEAATWGADLHKRLANQLDISNSLAQKCLSNLRIEGRLPKPTPRTGRKRPDTFRRPYEVVSSPLDTSMDPCFEVWMRD